MLHDIAIIATFLAMLIAPCVITLRTQRSVEETLDAPAETASRVR
jgi:hypothetical protein